MNPITDTLRFIRCGIGDETYALDMSRVRSIQRTDDLRPNAQLEAKNSAPVGWLPNNKGDIPVFSLAELLERPYPASPSMGNSNTLQRVIVLDTKPQPWALQVDRVLPVAQIPADHVTLLPPIVANPSIDYFQGIINLEQTLMMLLSPAWLDSVTPDNPTGYKAKIHPQNITHADAGKPAANTQESKTYHFNKQISKSGYMLVFSTTLPQPGERPLSFGLSVSQVPEVLNSLPLVPVPGVLPFVLGLVNWRNRPVPVINLNSRLGLASPLNPSTNGQNRLIITRGTTRDTFVGFPIEPEIRMLRLPIAHHPCTRTLPLDQTLTKGSVELENETLAIPDIQGILQQAG